MTQHTGSRNACAHSREAAGPSGPGRDLGIAIRAPIMRGMNIPTDNLPNGVSSDNPEHGFQFPGVFELSAMGTATAGLEKALPVLLEANGVSVHHERVSVRASSAGRYVSVRIAFEAQTREQYVAVHALLRSHPDVKWTV